MAKPQCQPLDSPAIPAPRGKPTSPLEPMGAQPWQSSAAGATVLTLRGTVSEEGHQQGHIVNVLQVGPHLVDAPGQLGLEEAKRPVALGWGAGCLHLTCLPLLLPFSSLDQP